MAPGVAHGLLHGMPRGQVVPGFSCGINRKRKKRKKDIGWTCSPDAKAFVVGFELAKERRREKKPADTLSLRRLSSGAVIEPFIRVWCVRL